MLYICIHVNNCNQIRIYITYVYTVYIKYLHIIFTYYTLYLHIIWTYISIYKGYEWILILSTFRVLNVQLRLGGEARGRLIPRWGFP